MNSSQKSPQVASAPTFMKRYFRDADAAVGYLTRIYEDNTAYLRAHYQRLTKGQKIPRRVSANYPYAAITVDRENLRRHEIDRRLSFGFVSYPGRYESTLTRPRQYWDYYKEQLSLLVKHHKVPVEIGVSDTPIPLHFAYPEGFHVEGYLTKTRKRQMRIAFDLPDILKMRDTIKAGSAAFISRKDPFPLSFFTAPRVDASLYRMTHYTGTSPSDCQSFVIYTNYDMYVQAFKEIAVNILNGHSELAYNIGSDGQYTQLVEPGGYTTYHKRMDREPSGNRAARMPQMPAYHLMREDGNGITLVNIGVGPTNAKNMSDHVAVTRPHAWVMAGHCAGLREDLELGDYILAQAYEGIRKDGIAVAEVTVALKKAVREVTGLEEEEVREIMRTGTVITVDDRNWEFEDDTIELIDRSHAIGLDMESGMLAHVATKYGIPSGALLCVSDKPLSGETKLPGMANNFYTTQTKFHLPSTMRAVEILRDELLSEPVRENTLFVHSRKLSPLTRAFR